MLWDVKKFGTQKVRGINVIHYFFKMVFKRLSKIFIAFKVLHFIAFLLRTNRATRRTRVRRRVSQSLRFGSVFPFRFFFYPPGANSSDNDSNLLQHICRSERLRSFSFFPYECLDGIGAGIRRRHCNFFTVYK